MEGPGRQWSVGGGNCKVFIEEILWEERREILEFCVHWPMRRRNMLTENEDSALLLVRPHLILYLSALLISFLFVEW
jgi:hypothetical protein